jgi:hypothetical protein
MTEPRASLLLVVLVVLVLSGVVALMGALLGAAHRLTRALIPRRRAHRAPPGPVQHARRTRPVPIPVTRPLPLIAATTEAIETKETGT